MGIRGSLQELRDFLGYKQKESSLRTRMIKRSLKKENIQVEYYNFKKVVFQQIDDILYEGDNSKVVLKPHEGKERYFNLLIQDEEFLRFYIGRITAGGELEVSIKKLE